jgi:hypothetical protein
VKKEHILEESESNSAAHTNQNTVYEDNSNSVGFYLNKEVCLIYRELKRDAEL